MELSPSASAVFGFFLVKQKSDRRLQVDMKRKHSLSRCTNMFLCLLRMCFTWNPSLTLQHQEHGHECLITAECNFANSAQCPFPSTVSGCLIFVLENEMVLTGGVWPCLASTVRLFHKITRQEKGENPRGCLGTGSLAGRVCIPAPAGICSFFLQDFPGSWIR